MNKFKTIFLALRNSKQFTQEQLSKELGVSKSTIAMWETGQRLPAPDVFEQIADYFNVDLDYLYGRSPIKRKIIYDENGNEYKNTEIFNIIEYMPIETISKLNTSNRARLNTYAEKLLSLQKMEEDPVLMAAHNDNSTDKEEQAAIMEDMDLLKRPNK